MADTPLDRSLEATVRRHPAGGVGNRRLSPAQADAIIARSVCPTCDGRDAGTTEESYASCIFCATGTRKPVLPDETLTTPAAAPVAVDATERPAPAEEPLAPVVPLRPSARFAGDEPLALD